MVIIENQITLILKNLPIKLLLSIIEEQIMINKIDQTIIILSKHHLKLKIINLFLQENNIINKIEKKFKIIILINGNKILNL